MKVWITKYALTNGVIENDAEICIDADETGNMISCGIGNYYHGEGKEWHKTKESAIKKADEMRQKKIESLKEQIEKLERMRFE